MGRDCQENADQPLFRKETPEWYTEWLTLIGITIFISKTPTSWDLSKTKSTVHFHKTDIFFSKKKNDNYKAKTPKSSNS